MGYGNFDGFIRYTAKVNSFMPLSSIPFLAWTATIAELVLGVFLLAGLWLRWTASSQCASADTFRNRHGHLVRAQVASGLLGFLCFRHSTFACTE